MLPTAHVLLEHHVSDDATFSAIVSQVGGPKRALQLLLDYAKKLEVFGALEDFGAVIAAADRVEDLAGKEQ
jgi:hypothetical protein